MRGHKIMGKWVLIRMKGRGEKQEPWLLCKDKDEYVKSALEYSVVDEYPDSVKAMDQPKGRAAHAKATVPAQTVTIKKMSKGLATEAVHPNAVEAALPEKLAPQLATLVNNPPTDPENWLYEIKFDGYRLLARVDGSDIKQFTRNGNDWTSKLKPLHSSIKAMKLPLGWYDGEIIVQNEHGLPDFGALQSSFDLARTEKIVFFVFDAPYFNGFDMRSVPLDERRAVLRSALMRAPNEKVRFSETFDGLPESVVISACKLGLEGVIAKRKDSTYQSARSAAWLKLKCSLRQEFIIGGWTDPKGARTGLGSLLLGVHDDLGHLLYAGNVGTGFNEKTLAALKQKLDLLTSTSSPFASNIGITGRPHWVEPRLVAEVTFGEWTREGRVRHSVFHGLRTDKEPKVIVREKAVSTPKATKRKLTKTAEPAEHQSQALSPKMRVTNPDRVIDPSSGITKIELVRYYALVGDLMMVHLNDRPVSLVRAPAGISGQLFFQKHAETEKLPGLRQLDPALYITHPAMLAVATKEGLLSAAQWNVVEIHTLNTSTKSFEHPDRIIFDLDPGEGVKWEGVQEAANVMRMFLEQLGLPAFLKTSGGKGLHVVVPIRKLHDWDSANGFSRAVVEHLSKTLPDRFVAKSGGKNRVGKIFIDYLRNGLGATTVCAWSARARPGLGISVPVEWSELRSLRGGDHWTIQTVHTRLDQGNDPWQGYAKAARSLVPAMKMLAYAPRMVAK